jgi:hypothetical protein
MATSPNDGWGPCPQGAIQKLAGRLTARRQRALALTILGGISAALITGVTAAAVTQYVAQSISASNQTNTCPTHPPVSDCPPDQKPTPAAPAK